MSRANSDSRPLPRGTLYVWPGGILFVGTDMVNEMHRHFTASVVLSLTGHFRVRAEGMDSSAAHRGLLVAPNVEQNMNAVGAEVVILQVDPESADFARLAPRFERNGPIHPLDDDTVDRMRARVRSLLDDTDFSPTTLWDRVIEELAMPAVAPDRPARDPRIEAVLRLVKDASPETPPAPKLAAHVGLSEGRLIHLFTEQMGLPIRRYALWLRLRDAFMSLAGGGSLTEAAHRAGFADSAHMTRTFRGMFGIPPSFFIEGRGTVTTRFVLSADPSTSPHPRDVERWARLRAGRHTE